MNENKTKQLPLKNENTIHRRFIQQLHLLPNLKYLSDNGQEKSSPFIKAKSQKLDWDVRELCAGQYRQLKSQQAKFEQLAFSISQLASSM